MPYYRGGDPRGLHHQKEEKEEGSDLLLTRRIGQGHAIVQSAVLGSYERVLSEEAIREFEDVFTRTIVQTYGLRLDCLIYDATDFFTYIDMESDSTLAQRGHSKEKQGDLKIDGLSLMVSPDFNVPLFHDLYAGNQTDAKQFLAVVERLQQRFERISDQKMEPTLVFDKGNNSAEHIQKLQSRKTKFHVVGSLKLSQCKSLLDIDRADFIPLSGVSYEGITAYRTKYPAYGQDMTVLVVHNPKLEASQLQGIHQHIEKCAVRLRDLQAKLQARREGTIRKGRKPTPDSIQHQVDQILYAEFMSELFLVDNHDWTNERIVAWSSIGSEGNTKCARNPLLRLRSWAFTKITRKLTLDHELQKRLS